MRRDVMSHTRVPTPLDTKLPPPVLLLLLCVSIVWLANAFPQAQMPLPFHVAIGTALIAVGLVLNAYPKILFARANTTINPMRPAASMVLLTSGLYRLTRNPMYLGQALILLGYAYLLRNKLGALAVPLYVAYITLFQILPEERALTAQFGARYEEYRKLVRRWL